MTVAMRKISESSQVAASPIACGNDVANPERATPCSASFHQLYRGMPSRLIASATSCICETFSSSRSEEHTSELQSQSNLVCRLLLEKKKKQTQIPQCHKTRRCLIIYTQTQ